MYDGRVLVVCLKLSNIAEVFLVNRSAEKNLTRYRM
jgi:hypothetical protein